MIFDNLSPREKAIVATSAIIAYLLAFVPIYQHIEGEIGALALPPVTLVALLYGVRAGFIASVAAIPVHMLLLNVAGVPGLDAIIEAGGVPGHVILIVLGTLLGWLRDVTTSLQRQNALRAASEATLRRRASELKALHETTLEIARPRDVSTLLETIVGRAVRLLDGRGGALYLCDSERRTIRCIVSYQTAKDYTGLTHQYGEGAAGTVAETGEPLIINEYHIWSGGLDVYQGDGYYTAVMSAPMTWEHSPIGVLNIYHNHQTRHFDTSDLELLSRFADQAAIAVENARLFESAQRRAREAETLREVAAALTSTLDRDQLLDNILVYLERVIPYDSASVILRTDDHLRVVAGRGYTDLGHVLDQTYPIDSPLPEEIRRTGRPVILEDAREDPRFRGGADAGHVRGWMGIPLRMRGKIIGHITIDSTHVGAYGEPEAELAQAFANHAAVALENANLYEQTYNRLRKVTLLSQAIRLTATAGELNSALEDLCAEMARFFDTPQAACALLNDDRTEARVVAEFRASNRPPAAGTVFPVDGNPSMQYILTHKVPLAITDAQTDPRLASVHDVMRRRGTVSLLLVPIFAGDEVVGTLGIDTLERREFSESDITLMQHIAQQVEHALERLRLFTATREHARRMADLAKISENLNRPFTVDGVIVAIGRGALALSETERAAIYVRLSETEARCAWSKGLSAAYVEEVIAKAQQLPGSRLWNATTPVLIPSIAELPRDSLLHKLAAEENFQAVALWPLVYEECAIAAVSCYYHEPRAWSEAEYEVMEAFTRQAAVALENARLYEKAQTLAITDGLTSLYNSRHFYSQLAKELERSRRYEHTCSLLMLDLDNFKSFNDQYGHQAGDDVLRELADLIRRVIRQPDTPARYGGEEFAVILPNTSGGEASEVAKRLRRVVEEHRFPLQDVDRHGHITISIGVATFPTDATSREELVQAADQALLWAKREKNQVCRHPAVMKGVGHRA